MLWSLFLRIVAAIVGVFLADKFVPGVSFHGKLFLLPTNQEQIHAFLNTLFAAGIFLGILNAIVKPILNLLALPLRIITLNLFSLVILVAMVWVTTIIFPNFDINGIVPLLWTTAIVWLLGIILTKWLPSK